MIATAIAPISLIAGTAVAFGTTHDPILIDGNDGWAAAALAGICTGTGTDVDPYVIANYDIQCTVATGTGITIKNSDVYFQINSCDLSSIWDVDHAHASDLTQIGIALDHVSNGQIVYTVSNNNKIGLYINASSKISLIGGAYEPYLGWGIADYDYNALKGIFVSGSSEITITDVMANYQYYGMYFGDSKNIQVLGGQAMVGVCGLYFGNCDGITVDCDASLVPFLANYNAWTGIDVRTSKNVTIGSANVMGNGYNGIFLSRDTNVLVTGTGYPSTLQVGSNSFNGLYAMSCVNVTVSGGDFGEYDDLNFLYNGNTRAGICLTTCTDVEIKDIKNSAAGNSGGGIMLVGCVNGSVTNSDSHNNVLSSGFYLSYCNNVTVSGCTATLNFNGIDIKGGLNLNVTGCSFTGNYGNGIYGTLTIRNVSIYQCDVSTNGMNGIYMLSCGGPKDNALKISSITSNTNGWNGICLIACPQANISGGSESSTTPLTVTGNGWNGVFLKLCSPVYVIGGGGGGAIDSNVLAGIYASICTGLLTSDVSTSNNNRDGVYVGICTNPLVAYCTIWNNAWYGFRAIATTGESMLEDDFSGNGFGVYYGPNAMPSAIFDINRIEMINSPIKFDASKSVDYDGTIAEYRWTFGDGDSETTTIPEVYHQYDTMDNYVVSLITVDNLGSLSPTPDHRQVAVQTATCAKINMTHSAAVNQVVPLSGAGSFAIDFVNFTITGWEWDFDDGDSDTGEYTSHAWTTEGVYNVGLRVQADDARAGYPDGVWSPWMRNEITISTDAVAALSVSLSRHSLFPQELATLTVKAVDGAGNQVTSCTDSVTVYANRSGAGWDWTLPQTVDLVDGEIDLEINCTMSNSYNITAELTADASVCGWEYVTIADETVEVRIYDLGQMPLGSVDDAITWPTSLDYNSGVPDPNHCDMWKHSYWNEQWRGKWGDCPFRYGPMAYNLYTTDNSKLLNSNVDTTCRVAMEARNISDISMSDPTFFPRLNTGTGGELSFSWSWEYLNRSTFWYWNANPDPTGVHPQNPFTWSPEDQANYWYPSQFYLYSISDSAYDGWETLMQVNMTMNREAAWELMGLPLGEDPITWWGTWHEEGENIITWNESVRNWYVSFLIGEGGGVSVPGRLDIKSCDDGYSWEAGFVGAQYFRLFDNGDGTVTLRQFRIGYGEDTLVSRWLYWGGTANGWGSLSYPNGSLDGVKPYHAGLLPFEMYYDNFTMVGTINDTAADLAMDCGMIYAFRAQKSADPSISSDTAVWRFEPVRVDYAESTGDGTWTRSEMDIWSKNVSKGVKFEVWDPCGANYGVSINPDQTPVIMDLRLGQSLIMDIARSHDPDLSWQWVRLGTGIDSLVTGERIAVSGIIPCAMVGDVTYQGDRLRSGYSHWIKICEKWGNTTIHPLGCPIVNDADLDNPTGFTPTYVIDKGSGTCTMVGPFWPTVNYYDIETLTWLWKNSAPLIEYWIE